MSTLTIRLPDDTHDRVKEIARRRGSDPATIRRRLSGDLDWIVLRALEKERERRYASASELAADIHRHLRDEPVLAVTWSKFRGPGAVSFADEAPDVELEDAAAGASGRASTTATMSEPGDYVLYAVVSDGSRQSNQCCWTNGYVRVRVGAADDGD